MKNRDKSMFYNTSLSRKELESIVTKLYSESFCGDVLEFKVEQFVESVCVSNDLRLKDTNLNTSIPLLNIYVVAFLEFSLDYHFGDFIKSTLDVVSIDLSKYYIDMASIEKIDKDILYDAVDKVCHRLPISEDHINRRISFFMKKICSLEGINQYTKGGTISLQSAREVFSEICTPRRLLTELLIANSDLCIKCSDD